jgi:hypothetical protein
VFFVAGRAGWLKNTLVQRIVNEPAAAFLLDDAGQTEAAVDVAKRISSETKRDALLARLTNSTGS